MSPARDIDNQKDLTQVQILKDFLLTMHKFQSKDSNRLIDSHKKFVTGLTMVEIMVSILLMSVVFLGVSSLYVASQKFYLTSSNKVIIGNEVQYAIQHIYKYVMRSMGDKNTPPFQITDATQLDISINDNDPLTRANYTSGVENYRYRYDATAKKIYFGVVDSGSEDDLIPKVSVTDVNFTKSTDALTGYITASYNDQSLTFYFACYPRHASFN